MLNLETEKLPAYARQFFALDGVLRVRKKNSQCEFKKKKSIKKPYCK